MEQAVKKAQDYLISMGYNGTVTDDELAAYVQRRRIETAYYEAGHTVAAVMCGGTVHHLISRCSRRRVDFGGGAPPC
jgi:hypothetical protein